MPYTPQVLEIIHALEKNGLSTGSVVQMFEAARTQVALGHRVRIVTRPGGELTPAARDAGIDVIELPLRSPFDLRSALALRRELLKRGADIIHVHKGRPHAIALIACLGLGPVPRIVVNRGVSFPLDPFNKWKYRHPRVAGVVCVAEAVRQVVIDSGGLDPERVHAIHAGVDVERFDSSRIDRPGRRLSWGLSTDEVVVMQVSVRDWKGWRELLEAFAALTARRPQARLAFVGCEPRGEYDKVEAAAAELGVDSSRLLLLPFTENMPEVLGSADIIVDASWAGTGITGTIREGLAMARPVVVSRLAGNPELVDSSVGRLVEARSVSGLEAVLDELIADSGLRAGLGEAGRRRVIDAFSTRRRVERLDALYRRILHLSEVSPLSETLSVTQRSR